jgi:hypothetical protein
MDFTDYFSPDYRTSRARFRSSAAARGACRESFPISASRPDGTPLDLTIDATILGLERSRRVVLVTSGLHGVEGFFGSAVQFALLDEAWRGWQPPAGAAVILLHALCPFGFDQLRRANEDNIDLNRNFLRPGEEYAGRPPGYAGLDPLLNPTHPPRRWDLFLPRLWLAGMMRGPQAVRQAIAAGQYEYPRGLFFGGRAPSATMRTLAENVPHWLGHAERIVHIDFHTGLGRWATYKLLTENTEGSPRVGWLRERFGATVESVQTGTTAYSTRGGIDHWLEALFADRECYSVCAEFGTYGPMTVLAALRSENMAHHWGQTAAKTVSAVKQRLCEVFAPASQSWRRQVVAQGVEIVRRAIDVCFAPPVAPALPR